MPFVVLAEAAGAVLRLEAVRVGVVRVEAVLEPEGALGEELVLEEPAGRGDFAAAGSSEPNESRMFNPKLSDTRASNPRLSDPADPALLGLGSVDSELAAAC